MRIVMTDTVNHTRKIINFNEVCNKLNGNENKGRIKINYKLLNNEVIKNGNYEIKREIN